MGGSQEPREIPHRHKENIQTHHRKTQTSPQVQTMNLFAELTTAPVFHPFTKISHFFIFSYRNRLVLSSMTGEQQTHPLLVHTYSHPGIITPSYIHSYHILIALYHDAPIALGISSHQCEMKSFSASHNGDE